MKKTTLVTTILFTTVILLLTSVIMSGANNTFQDHYIDKLRKERIDVYLQSIDIK